MKRYRIKYIEGVYRVEKFCETFGWFKKKEKWIEQGCMFLLEGGKLKEYPFEHESDARSYIKQLKKEDVEKQADVEYIYV